MFFSFKESLPLEVELILLLQNRITCKSQRVVYIDYSHKENSNSDSPFLLKKDMKLLFIFYYQLNCME